MRESLEAIEEQIENAKTMSKKKDANSLQWSKQLLNLIQERDVILERVKGHLLGRDETGAIKEPEDSWDYNGQVEYERNFHNFLKPWTKDDLKLKCEDCGVSSEEVTNQFFNEVQDNHYRTIREAENVDLCPKCYEKRTSPDETEDAPDPSATTTEEVK